MPFGNTGDAAAEDRAVHEDCEYGRGGARAGSAQDVGGGDRPGERERNGRAGARATAP